MNRCTRAMLALTVTLCVIGCGRTSTMTQVNPDGSFVRTLTFRGPAPAEGEGAIMTGPTVDTLFELPGGAAWKVTREKKDNELIVTATRTFPAGTAAQQDIALKAKGKAPMGRLIVNSVVIRQIAPGRWEYRETLRWQGERPKELVNPDPKMLTAIKAALPANLATDANVLEVAQIAIKGLWRLLFGPGDPLVSQLVMHPELAERKLKRLATQVLTAALEQKFANQLSAESRTVIARKIVEQGLESTKTLTQEKANPSTPPQKEEDEPASLVAMGFTVKLPGKILSANGEVDEASGEVFWALYAQAAAIGDVEMVAVCETGN
jgi:hypothetical protein